MKKILIALLLGTLFTSSAKAQEDTETDDQEHTVRLGSGGLKIGNTDKPEGVISVQYGMLDLGMNTLHDRTDYSRPQTGLQDVPGAYRNENLFSLRQGKSTNVNIYPVLLKARLLKTGGQRIYLSTGVGLQLYNFAFNKPVSYINNTTPTIILDSVAFSKNKLKFNYLVVPLSLTFKTRLVRDLNSSITKDISLVYGFGISAGYRLDSWTKQISAVRGKQKNHDAFNFRDYNLCLTGEFGINDIIRLYASYQLTSLEKDGGLDQHPFCIGVRFSGI